MKKKTFEISMILVFILYLLLPVSGWTTVYVDESNIKGPWDGNSWETAYKSVQEGLDNAVNAGEEVWVAEGKYFTTESTDRDIATELRSGVDLYGGFKGNETKLESRDWEKNQTILDGDIGKQGDADDNSRHVVIGADDAIIDGFTIQNGGDTADDGMPGGPQVLEDGRTQTHSTPERVMQGSAKSSRSGGGMINFQCAPTIRNCIFRNNYSGKGGAMYNMVAKGRNREPEPAPLIINCTFIDNYSRNRGAAASNDFNTHPTFIGCKFINNRSTYKGGAIYNDFGCSPNFINCLFAGNSSDRGGAIANDGSARPIITNCTFANNTAVSAGPALYQGTGGPNCPVVTNTIVWGNTTLVGDAGISNWHMSEPEVTYSCVEGG
jgi:hypothetical protein